MIKKFRCFHRFLLYDFHFGFYSSNASNIYYKTKHTCIHYGLFLQQIFYSSPSHFYAYYCLCVFGSNLLNSSTTTPCISSFILPTTNFLNHYSIFTYVNSYQNQTFLSPYYNLQKHLKF